MIFLKITVNNFLDNISTEGQIFPESFWPEGYTHMLLQGKHDGLLMYRTLNVTTKHIIYATVLNAM